jgi:hypothetical protein
MLTSFSKARLIGLFDDRLNHLKVALRRQDAKVMDLKMPSETVRRGQRLAARQRAHLFELELTGRWRLYFKSEEEFKAKIEAASESIAQWAQLVPEQPAAEQLEAQESEQESEQESDAEGAEPEQSDAAKQPEPCKDF